MIRLPEDDQKTDLLLATTTTPPSGQPFTSSSSNTVSPLNDSQLEATDNGAHPLIDMGNASHSPDSLPPPPDFTQYEAEHFEVGYSDVVSHDPHLNSDG